MRASVVVLDRGGVGHVGYKGKPQVYSGCLNSWCLKRYWAGMNGSLHLE